MSSMAPTRLAPVPTYGQDRGDDPSDSQSLWAMTHRQRIDAMWDGKLTRSQLNEWNRKAPQEIPLIDNEFAWIIMRTPEWDEMTPQQRYDNVISLAALRGFDRVAA